MRAPAWKLGVVAAPSFRARLDPRRLLERGDHRHHGQPRSDNTRAGALPPKQFSRRGHFSTNAMSARHVMHGSAAVAAAANYRLSRLAALLAALLLTAPPHYSYVRCRSLVSQGDAAAAAAAAQAVANALAVAASLRGSMTAADTSAADPPATGDGGTTLSRLTQGGNNAVHQAALPASRTEARPHADLAAAAVGQQQAPPNLLPAAGTADPAMAQNYVQQANQFPAPQLPAVSSGYGQQPAAVATPHQAAAPTEHRQWEASQYPAAPFASTSPVSTVVSLRPQQALQQQPVGVQQWAANAGAQSFHATAADPHHDQVSAYQGLDGITPLLGYAPYAPTAAVLGGGTVLPATAVAPAAAALPYNLPAAAATTATGGTTAGGGINVVTSNPISISNPISVLTPNTQLTSTFQKGGLGLGLGGGGFFGRRRRLMMTGGPL